MYKYLFLFYHTAVGLIGSIATLINFIAPHGIEETDTVLAAESLVITGVSYKIYEENFTNLILKMKYLICLFFIIDRLL